MHLSNIIQKITAFFFSYPPKETAPETAYNLWADTYDNQPKNLVLALDESIFINLLADVAIQNKTVADIGCGTGRHWKYILDQQPASLTGYDVSESMLQVLKQKFPEQKVIQITSTYLNEPDQSCDLVVSTLALAHILDMRSALQEWCRILKPGGDLIITDYHPVALEKGGSRTFRHHNHLVIVKSYIHPIDTVINAAKQLNLDVSRYIEKVIDDSVRSWYEHQNALTTFNQFKGTPIVYGLHLKKKDAAS